MGFEKQMDRTFLLNIEIKINDIVVMLIDFEVNIHKQINEQNQSV